MDEPTAGAEAAGAALSTAAVCVAWAMVAAGNKNSAIRAAVRVERIFYDFQLILQRI
jgi:hypothetical protein